jgi:tetratricopeptide (TPR) repeat protein
VGPDTVTELLKVGSELLEVAGDLGDAERMLDGHFIRIIAHEQAGAIAKAERELMAAASIANALRQPTFMWEVAASQAANALFAGELAGAKELIDQALRVGQRAQPAEAMPVYHLQRSTLFELVGDVEEVEPAMREVAAAYPARPVFRCALAQLHARIGRAAQAKRTLNELAAEGFSGVPFDQEWLLGMSFLAETSVLVDDIDSAATLYRLLLPWAAFNAADHPEGIRGSISRHLGMLATTADRWVEAERHFEEALERNAEMGARPWLAHTQRDYALMLLSRDEPGDGPRARDLIAEALALYEEVGMLSWAKDTRELEQRSRGPGPGRGSAAGR